jgi:hypothetical protein
LRRIHRSIALDWALVLRVFKKPEEAEMEVGVGVREEETRPGTTSQDIGAGERERMESDLTKHTEVLHSEFLRCLETTGDGKEDLRKNRERSE